MDSSLWWRLALAAKFWQGSIIIWDLHRLLGRSGHGRIAVVVGGPEWSRSVRFGRDFNGEWNGVSMLVSVVCTCAQVWDVHEWVTGK